MEAVTLVIAVVGALTGVASLTWSVTSHVLSGGRVSVELRGGWVGGPNLFTAPLTRKPIRPDWNFVDTPVLAVRASNTGRLPVSVEGWAVKVGSVSIGQVQHPANEPLPKLLGVGESAIWIVPADQIFAAAHASQSVGMASEELRATVTLGAGKARTSKASEVTTSKLPEVLSMAR